MHLLALLLVLSIGVDYAVFLLASPRDAGARAASAFSLVVACASTLLAFGLLSLSSFPALRPLGVTTGLGAVMNTAKAGPGSNAVVFGLGGIGLNVIQGCRMVGCDKIVGVDTNPDKRVLAEKFGMTDFVNPSDVDGDLVGHLVELTGGGADYSFECIGNVDVMRTALECCHKGWGESIIIGVAGAGQEIATRPFQLVTGRVWRGTAFGGAKGRTDVPRIVDWYMDGKINIDDLITHTMPLDDINKGFDLMHAGESIRSVVVF